MESGHLVQGNYHAMQHYGIKILLGLTSALGKELLPRIAARLDAPLVMDCVAVNLAAKTVKKSQYSGKTIAIIKARGTHFIFRPAAQCHRAATCRRPRRGDYL